MCVYLLTKCFPPLLLMESRMQCLEIIFYVVSGEDRKSKSGLLFQVMVTNVTSLLKTVKAVEDEHSRGTRALEATIEAIGQEIRVSHFPPKSTNGVLIVCPKLQALQSNEAPKMKVNPEDLVRCAKPITQATAKAVAAGNSGKQDDIIVAANMGRKAISDMLTICKVSENSRKSVCFNYFIQLVHLNGLFLCFSLLLSKRTASSCATELSSLVSTCPRTTENCCRWC